MTKITHEQILLDHFAKHKTITSKEAFDLYGMTRLSAVVFNLREQGYEIGMVWEQGVNRYGNSIKWGKFFLQKAPKKQTLMDKILAKMPKKQEK